MSEEDVIVIDPLDLAPRGPHRIGEMFRASSVVKDPHYITKVWRWNGERWQRLPDRKSGYREGRWFEETPPELALPSAILEGRKG